MSDDADVKPTESKPPPPAPRPEDPGKPIQEGDGNGDRLWRDPGVPDWRIATVEDGRRL